jgi:hypothetical protein
MEKTDNSKVIDNKDEATGTLSEPPSKVGQCL